MTIPVRSGVGQRWDLSPIFPAIDSPQYEGYVEAFQAEIAAFSGALAQRQGSAPLDKRSLTRLLLDFEGLELKQDLLVNYVACLRAEDPLNPRVSAANLRQQRLFGEIKSLRASFLRELNRFNETDFEALAASPELRSARHRVNLLRHEAKNTLSEREEKLAGELDVDGRQRWARLAADTLAQTTFDVRMPSGRLENMTMSRRFELTWDRNPEVRRAAFDAINQAFAPKAELMAACLNAMAGTGITLAHWRGLDPIDEAMLDNWINSSTVKTMQDALREHTPVLQDYLRRKAKLLGLSSLGVFDRSAPLDIPELAANSVMDAGTRIVEAFRSYCPEMADHAQHVVDSRWVESEMRSGKQPGGFCASLSAISETRIFISFGGSFNAIAMLAHELGHSYHAFRNFPFRFWEQHAPSSLSETASILCEHFVRRHVYSSETASARLRLGALASQLDSAVNYLLRIPRDFDFEVDFYRERARGEVSAERLCELMRNAHRTWFDTALSGDDGDGLAWAYNHIMMVPHYRIYNFPYSFGYLLSGRIADAFEENGDAFTPAYNAFLRASASMPVEKAVASTLGFDVTKKAFWDESLSGVLAQIDLFAELAASATEFAVARNA